MYRNDPIIGDSVSPRACSGERRWEPPGSLPGAAVVSATWQRTGGVQPRRASGAGGRAGDSRPVPRWVDTDGGSWDCRAGRCWLPAAAGAARALPECPCNLSPLHGVQKRSYYRGVCLSERSWTGGYLADAGDWRREPPAGILQPLLPLPVLLRLPAGPVVLFRRFCLPVRPVESPVLLEA